MIEIVTALMPEAAELIRILALKKTEDRPFRRYRNPETGIGLTISGTGKVAAAAAVGAVLSRYSAVERRAVGLVNFGSCGAPEGVPRTLYLIHKLTDADTGRTFYPDLFTDCPYPETALYTCSRPWMGKSIVPGEEGADRAETAATDRPPVYDMEGAAVYEAGNLFLGPHQLHFLKGVTDHGSRNTASAGLSDFKGTMSGYARLALPYLQQLRSADTAGSAGARSVNAEETAESAHIAVTLHCSVTMELEVRQLVHYAVLSGTDPEAAFLESLADCGFSSSDGQVCRDRRDGKRVLQRFRMRLQGLS